MHILQVDLENVKSYTQASISFTPGTNAICGHNGAGKSTLLEAIGFTLFDYLAVSQADFVREGEKLATVTVRVADQDGRNYQVVRKCGSYSQHYVYEPELQEKLTDGKQETMAWLAELMGTDDHGDLGVLFRDAVGVPQGLLTAAFLSPPSRRKDTFNPLLRVDEYEHVWESLREPGRRLEQQIAATETCIAGLAAQVTALPGMRERMTLLTAEIEAGATQQAELEQSHTDVTEDLAVLAARKKELDQLDQALHQADSIRNATRVRLEDAQAAVTAAETAQAIVAMTETGHTAYIETQNEQATLEAARQVRDALVADRQQAEQALAVSRERATRFEAELQAIADAKVTITRLAPEVAQQEKLEAELQIMQRNADHLVSAQQELSREKARLVELEQRYDDAVVQTEARALKETELTEAQEELANRERKHERLVTEVSALDKERARIETQIAEGKRRVHDAANGLTQERERLTQLETRLAAVKQQLTELMGVEVEIEAAREALKAKATERQAAVKRVADSSAALEHAQRQIEILSTSQEPECPVCGRPLTPDHRADLTAQYQTRADDLENEKAAAEQALAATIAAIRAQEATSARLEARARALPRPEEAQALEEQQSNQEAAVKKHIDTLAAEQATLKTQQAELSALVTTLETQKNNLSSMNEHVATQQKIIQELTDILQGLAHPAEVALLTHEISQQKESIIEAESTVTDLASAPETAARLTEDLVALGDPRRAYNRATDIAARETDVAAQHAAAEIEISRLETCSEDLQQQLATYADLDDQISQARQALAKHEADHRRYLQHEREASTLITRRATVANLVSEAETAEATYAEYAASRAAVAATYDAGLHAKLTDELGELRALLAAGTERLHQQRTQLEETTEAVGNLEAIQVKLDNAQSELETQQETLALLNTLRHVLREAGPEVTRALVQMISLHADRLYADIMQNYRSRLRWTEDYEIVLTTEGRDRTFQQLSGGEQMAAGLAVRLALLHETSTVDVAFFDEPTANLDNERRFNLAQQILNIKGFSQLFVISHDDTFEQDTDHVVHIHKENGVSIVTEENSG